MEKLYGKTKQLPGLKIPLNEVPGIIKILKSFDKPDRGIIEEFEKYLPQLKRKPPSHT